MKRMNLFSFALVTATLGLILSAGSPEVAEPGVSPKNIKTSTERNHLDKNLTIAQAPMPVIDGEWWPVTSTPKDLGELGSPRVQLVDFGVWQAKDGTWQLWSCVRNTKEAGKERLLYGWEGKSITTHHWNAKGIQMRAKPELGETAGGLQAPFTLREGDTWEMYYGDWNAICMAASADGKTFERIIQSNMERVTAMFTEGAGTNTRDAMTMKEGDTYYCYYTAGTGFWDEKDQEKTGAVYCRTSKDKKHWSASSIVSKGGQYGNGWGDHECPFVVRSGDGFYLFRTHRYGKDNMTSVYYSKDPMNFGIGTDKGFLVGTLPVAAPEIIIDNGQWYIFALNPALDGMRAAKLKFVKQ